MEWNRIDKLKPEPGLEVLLYSNHLDCEVYHLGAYFKKGDTLDENSIFFGSTPEEILLNVIRKRNPVIIAKEEGVYVKEDPGTGNLEYRIAKEFSHWMPLPKPPKGDENICQKL